MTATQDIQSANDQHSGHSLQRVVRRFPRRPGIGWKHIEGSAVWEHTTGLRIHRLGMARLPDGRCVSWMNQPHWMEAYEAKRQQGWNEKRALMVWALSLLSPNVQVEGPADNATPQKNQTH